VRVPLFIAAVLLAAFAAGAEPLAVGDRLEPFAIEDQHGNEHVVDARVRALLFARDMKGGGVVKQALADSGAALLAEADAVYVANVSGMPAVIRRMFALPSLRRRGYPVLLDSEGQITKNLPGVEDRATLIQLRELTVVDVTQFESSEAVREALHSLRRDSPKSD